MPQLLLARPVPVLMVLAAVLGLAACTTPPGGAAARPAVAASAASAPAVAASAPTPGQPPTFAVVVKDAKKVAEGLFTVWQKDEKFWFELRTEDFGRPFFLSPKLAGGIGEDGFFGGMMARPQVVELRRVHNQVQLLALNTAYIAKAGTPEGRALAAAYSPSLLASSAVASQPHPERKTVLVDAGALFVNDMLGLGLQLQRNYRQGYSLDGRNSAITAVRGKPELLVFEVSNHYAASSLATAQPGAPSGVPQPSVPRSLPDPRSLFMRLHYSLAPLPEQVMASRRADPRIGHFAHAQDDFGDDLARTPRQRYIARWRLEKKDPAAALSEPVKPITYWIDRTVPLKYRDAVSAGILEWNKAFERIGFKDAIEVKVQPDDADFDTLDFGVASVRWMTNVRPQFGAIGPRHVDPRSGEILDADISLESLSARNVRSYRARVFGAASAEAWNALLQVGGAPADGHDPQQCLQADLAAEQLDFGLEALAARGELDPAGPEAEAFVQAYLKDVTMHEVGHTLGLRHNFRASRVYSEAQLSDPEFTRTHALTGSVMEYAPINLPRPGAPRPSPFQTTLGPYDYWAIEYAYKPLAPADEAAELTRIAGRSGEPELAYGTDEDFFAGADPEVLQGDLGDDPLAFAAKRFDIDQDLFKRQEGRRLGADDDFSALRRVLNYALRDAARSAGTLLRQIGGLRMLRDHANTGRDPLQPLPAARQRAALDLLTRQVLAADSFVVSPALQRRLAPDYLERADAVLAGDYGAVGEPSLGQAVHEMRRTVLAQLTSDGLAARMLDNGERAGRESDTLGLAELYRRIDGAVWSELGGHGDIPAPRRELQREHVNRLTALLLRPGALSRADARALLRQHAGQLLKRLDVAAQRPGLGEAARLHLRDSADSLRAALAAPLQRAGA